MRRVVSLFLPRWPTDRLRRKNPDLSGRDKPLVTAAAQGQRRVLASVDETANKITAVIEPCLIDDSILQIRYPIFRLEIKGDPSDNSTGDAGAK